VINAVLLVIEAQLSEFYQYDKVRSESILAAFRVFTSSSKTKKTRKL